MSIITRYVRWIGHDAAGTLPPVDVVAGIVRPGAWRMPAWWPPLAPDETLVFVPAQWIGEWENGHTLAPAYQYLWRVSQARLRSLPGTPIDTSYRPAHLPESPFGPRLSRKRIHRKRSGSA